MRVIVTGATGFLGREVSYALTAAGHEVLALSRHGAVDQTSSSEVIRADLRDAESIRDGLKDINGLDAVCHLAAYTNARESAKQPLPYWDVNTAGTLRLLQVLAEHALAPVRVVFASTGAVYGDGQAQPLSEDTKPAPHSPYGTSKLAAEYLLGDLARTGIIKATILRTFNLAGASRGLPDPDTTRVIPGVLAVAIGDRSRFTINGPGDGIREYTHVADVANAYLAAIEHPQNTPVEVYNIGSGTGSTILDVVEMARIVTAAEIPIEHVPAKHEPAALVADPRRAREVLGWTATRSDLRQLITDAWASLHSSYTQTGPTN